MANYWRKEANSVETTTRRRIELISKNLDSFERIDQSNDTSLPFQHDSFF
jgi:hypothetical protein